MSGSIRIVEMPNLGALNDSSLLVGELAGSGLFSATALRTYINGGLTPYVPLAGVTPMTGPLVVHSSGTLNSQSTVGNAAFGTGNGAILADFGLAALTAMAGPNQNCIVGQVTNSQPEATASYPTGVTGYARITTEGNFGFGMFGRADLATVGVHGVAINELNTFNYAGTPSGTLPPNMTVGTPDYVACALVLACYGNFSSSCALNIAWGAPDPTAQQFQLGIYVEPGAALGSALYIDATASLGTMTYSALIRNQGSGINLRLQTMGAPSSSFHMFECVDSAGTVKFAVTQSGSFNNPGFSLPNTGTLTFTAPTVTTSATAGSASALPGPPANYLTVNIGGTNFKLPYYNV